MISLMMTPPEAGITQARRKRIPLKNFTPVFMSNQTELADGVAPAAGGATEAGGEMEPCEQSVLLCFHHFIPESNPGRAESHPRAAHAIDFERRTCPYCSHSSAERQQLN